MAWWLATPRKRDAGEWCQTRPAFRHARSAEELGHVSPRHRGGRGDQEAKPPARPTSTGPENVTEKRSAGRRPLRRSGQGRRTSHGCFWALQLIVREQRCSTLGRARCGGFRESRFLFATGWLCGDPRVGLLRLTCSSFLAIGPPPGTVCLSASLAHAVRAGPITAGLDLPRFLPLRSSALVLARGCCPAPETFLGRSPLLPSLLICRSSRLSFYSFVLISLRFGSGQRQKCMG